VRVLGIESSCDETAAGVVGPEGVLSDVTYTQEIHARFGGVVPEWASRAHADRISATTREALDQAGLERPDAVAATAGPGLIGAVLVGFSFAKAAALAWDVPFVGVNHLEGHLLSPTLEDPGLEVPFLALVVSGGHTSLYRADAVGSYRTVAQTVDDAAGEAFDKVARLLRLGYPGGPAIDRLAKGGDPDAIRLPRPKASGLNMSFSGLKTAVRSYVEAHPDLHPPDLAASFQEAVCDVLCDRVMRAAKQEGIRRVAVSGGVAANSRLRERLQALPIEVHIPAFRFCTDNGAMIAHAGRQRLMLGERHGLDLRARSVWPLDTP
jgi:N6-L-threonylcarbamoyladenine synthase